MRATDRRPCATHAASDDTCAPRRAFPHSPGTIARAAVPIAGNGHDRYPARVRRHRGAGRSRWAGSEHRTSSSSRRLSLRKPRQACRQICSGTRAPQARERSEQLVRQPGNRSCGVWSVRPDSRAAFSELMQPRSPFADPPLTEQVARSRKFSRQRRRHTNPCVASLPSCCLWSTPSRRVQVRAKASVHVLPRRNSLVRKRESTSVGANRRLNNISNSYYFNLSCRLVLVKQPGQNVSHCFGRIRSRARL